MDGDVFKCPCRRLIYGVEAHRSAKRWPGTVPLAIAKEVAARVQKQWSPPGPDAKHLAAEGTEFICHSRQLQRRWRPGKWRPEWSLHSVC